MQNNSHTSRKWWIYKIENPIGQVYVGRTCNLEARKKFHLGVKRKKRNIHLRESILKYGVKAHVFTILDEFVSTECYADGKEMFWIRSYMSNRQKWPEQSGFNMTNGGRGLNSFFRHSDETKIKMSKSASKKIFTETHRKNIGKTRSVPISQYSISGEFIKEFDSIAQASFELWGKRGGRHISTVCQGKEKQCGGYIFKYKNQPNAFKS